VFFSKVCSEKIQQVRIIPRYSYYVIEIVYEKETPVIKEVDNKLSIDIGLNNLSAVYIDNNKTFLVIVHVGVISTKYLI
jgi:transposase